MFNILVNIGHLDLLRRQ